MPKKSTRNNLRESRIGKRLEGCKIASSEVIVKQFRSIHVNVKNAKRWFMLKKRLSIVTDDELVSYLLDLAEPIIRRDGRCSRAGDWKTDQDKENDLDVVKIEEKDSLGVEEPLRRSPRKQCIVPAVGAAAAEPAVAEPPEFPKSTPAKQPEIAAVESESQEGHVEKPRTRVKHRHKTKEKHHREKRTRRTHSKNNNNEAETKNTSADERPVLSRVTVEAEESEETSNETRRVVERLSPKQEPLISCATNDEDAEDAEDAGDNKNVVETKNVTRSKRSGASIVANDEKPIVTESRIETDIQAERATISRASTETATVPGNDFDVSNVPKSDGDSSEENKSPTNDRGAVELEAVVTTSEKTADKEQVDRRGKKRRKHGKRVDPSPSKQEESHARTSETLQTATKQTNEILHKRRKKKHKRGAASSIPHRTKKFHDFRKAPQDGVIGDSNVGDESIVNGTIHDDATNETLVANAVETSSELVESTTGEIPEPQRLAIKIKLCQDCNDRHIEDSCPLISTNIHLSDRMNYGEWLAKHSDNAEVSKAVASEDPISEGYAVTNDENYESDEDNAGVEQPGKTKTKNESEDKQLHINDERPLYSRESLPECLELGLSSPEHGIGVYAASPLPIYAKLGPLVGDPIKEMDIPDDFSMRHLWEIDNDGKTSYVSTTNPLKSNWIRYTRPADTKEDRSVTVVTRNGELYLVTTRNIAKGMELTYWADSQSSAWTRKNKIDKTNCGGCNLNFGHSIYYRLHCCIFHDTRYSLTIRKYHCKVCGAAVLGKDNIMKHAADLHGGRGAYQCQYCRKFFLRLNYLEMHRTYGCSQNPQRSRPLCDFCGRKFCQPQKLKVHIKRMHSDMSEVLREFQCKMCLKLLGSRAALQRHMKEVHHKDVVGAATCDRCGKMFQNKSNLKIHMLTHSGVKPFKCKEADCKAAFTTKQCLQFHYKKVHGLSEDMMPKIERSVAYTFDAYSGGLVEGIEAQKVQPSDERSSQQENSNSVMSLEDCSSEHSSRAELPTSSFQPTTTTTTPTAPTISEFESSVVSTPRYNLDRYILDRDEQDNDLQQDPENHESTMQDCEMDNHQLQEREMQERELQEREMREREMQEREMQEREMQEREMQERELQEREMHECESRERDDTRDRDIHEYEVQEREIQRLPPSPISPRSHQDIQLAETPLETERAPGDVDFYGTRLQSKGSKKWMGQFNGLSEADIVTQHHSDGATARPDVYEFNDASMKKSEDRGVNGATTSNGLMSGAKLGLNLYRRPESTNASLLVEAALDAAERDIGAVTSPMIDDNDRDTNIYAISSQLQARHNGAHLDPYIQQQDELMSPASMSQDHRKTPNSHVHMDYHIHRPVDYINSPRSHGIEQYLPQDDLPRVGSPGPYNIHLQQDELASPPSPNQNRYQDIHHHHHHHQEQQQQQQHQQQHHHHHHHHHHQVPSDNLSSDEGDSVAQNLSISVKEKALQLDLTTSYKYEQLDSEFTRERTNFEPLVLSNGELQGLDMSARGFHHPLGSQITNTRYHHHLYEITERQSVDLSRTTGYSISPPPTTVPPPPPPPLYPHSDVLRIVSLDLTPGHSVDLSLSRSHHLHSTGGRISPQPTGSSGSHVVPDTVETRNLPSPPPSVTGYNATYPVSPAPYHPPRPGYHHYSGYY